MKTCDSTRWTLSDCHDLSLRPISISYDFQAEQILHNPHWTVRLCDNASEVALKPVSIVTQSIKIGQVSWQQWCHGACLISKWSNHNKSTGSSGFATWWPVRSVCWLPCRGRLVHDHRCPADTRRNNNVIMTPKRRHTVVLTSWKWRYYCAMYPLGRWGSTPCDRSGWISEFIVLLVNTTIRGMILFEVGD